MDTREQILNRDYPADFDALSQNRIVVSHYKYGWCSDTYPELADAIACARQRIELYEKTGNKEHLVDAANFLRIEFKYPKHPNAHFRATDSSESPGLSGLDGKGISAKELMEEA